MKYQNKSFSVPAVGERKECESHWKDRRGFCVFCGEPMFLLKYRDIAALCRPPIEISSEWDDD